MSATLAAFAVLLFMIVGAQGVPLSTEEYDALIAVFDALGSLLGRWTLRRWAVCLISLSQGAKMTQYTALDVRRRIFVMEGKSSAPLLATSRNCSFVLPLPSFDTRTLIYWTLFSAEISRK